MVSTFVAYFHIVDMPISNGILNVINLLTYKTFVVADKTIYAAKVNYHNSYKKYMEIKAIFI